MINLRYLGGKSKVCKQIASFLNKKIIEVETPFFYDICCGSCYVSQHIVCQNRICVDKCEPLVKMWTALKEGWQPPDEISEETYKRAQHHPEEFDPALLAFIMFGCSFGGKWNGGYARYKNTNFAAQSKRSLLKKIENLKGCEFAYTDYSEVVPPKGSVVYIDPPYTGTTKYGWFNETFDHIKFWNYVRKLSVDNYVYVSEYVAPPDFKISLEMPTKTNLHNTIGSNIDRIERLFHYEP